MTFVTLQFYVFLVLVVAIYYILPLKYRWYILLTGSLAFYWYISDNSLKKFGMLIGAAIICWALSLLMLKFSRFKKLIFTIDLLVIIIPILAIKELSFAEYLFNFSTPEWWIVPIGVAFYSMQLIAYVVDVYKEKITPEKNVLKFLLFISFFPQILQGPIPRYQQLAPQSTKGHAFDETKFVNGFMLIIWAFFLKLCIADKAGVVVNTVFDNYPTYKGVFVLVAGILYSFQLYTDFMACTSFAQGIAELFGIDIIDNFNHPYFSTSIKDFWRRWHISLSSWLRDYVYIPLGGNRKGKIRKYINLLLTFVVSGIWHGAGYKFLFWGLLHGAYQIMGELLTPLKNKVDEICHLDKRPIFLKIFRMIFTFGLVTVAWVIFRADHLRIGLSMLKSVATVHNTWVLTNDALFTLGLSWKEFILLLICLIILLIVSKKQEDGIHIRERILRCNLIVRWCIYIGAIIFVMVFGTYGYGYDAQAFIYGGF